MPEVDARKLAEEIADLVRSESGGSSDGGVSQALEDIRKRLDALENAGQATAGSPERALTGHPSLAKYKVIEAVSVNSADEKTCEFEPNERTCDHCSMCSSRGF